MAYDKGVPLSQMDKHNIFPQILIILLKHNIMPVVAMLQC